MNSEKIYMGADTSILLSNYDFKKVSELSESDQTYGNKLIKSERIKSPGDMYRIITKYGNSFVINGDSSILIYKNSIKCIIRRKVKEIPHNDIDLSIYKANIEFPRLNLPIQPYLFGFLLRIRSKNRRFIRFSNFSKIFIISSIRKLKLKYFTLKDYILVVISRRILKSLIQNDSIPNIYKKNSISNRLELVAGIIDSESSCDPLNKFIEIKGLKKNLCRDIYSVLTSLGFNITYRYNFMDQWIINLYGSDKLSNIPMLVKKYNIEPSTPNHFRIIKINSSEAVLLEIEKTNQYSIITNDFFYI